MSYSSRIDSPAHWVSNGVKWFLFRLFVYVAVAAISAGLFFVGAAVYALLSRPAELSMLADLSLAVCVAIAGIALLGLFSWPNLRLRTDKRGPRGSAHH